MKKKIIVPVDFSAPSQNAYLYAREMAAAFGAEIELLHVELPDTKKTPLEKITKDLSDFSGLFPKDSGEVMTRLEVNVKAVYGAPIDTIVNHSKDAFMIIMGKTGEQKIIEKIIGTVSSAVAQRAACPVLLVPKNAKYRPVENIVYASNYDSADNTVLAKIMDFANVFRAGMHFIHVRNFEDLENFEKTEEKIYESLFSKGDPAFAFTMMAVENNSVVEGLDNYARAKDADLVVMVNCERRVIETIIGESTTKTMALKFPRPLLVYHIDKEKTKQMK